MRDAISTTAEYGDYTVGPKLIDSSVKAGMKEVLAEIQSGKFAKEFIDQYKAGHPELKKQRQRHDDMQIEQVGAKLRAMMPWLDHKNE